jgi:hypothetical protein
MLLGSRFHPVWTMVAAAILVTSGLSLLFGDLYAVAVGLVVYGAGNGLTSIVRGTLPLALFGPEGYATLMGRIGRPVMIALAVAPLSQPSSSTGTERRSWWRPVRSVGHGGDARLPRGREPHYQPFSQGARHQPSY